MTNLEKAIKEADEAAHEARGWYTPNEQQQQILASLESIVEALTIIKDELQQRHD